MENQLPNKQRHLNKNKEYQTTKKSRRFASNTQNSTKKQKQLPKNQFTTQKHEVR
ncbi:hypothetical protein LC1Nh_0697 [Candidatus Nanohalobium constans]|uniref:Uncharacterized protein n=1 Tax=Candidatus Nanohalobium constans TaxID=2565781 RepID=A0A5Q0UG68_9ARCH|nr:hypothetical protein LC1Nh_0697 [Candidatus Nanohalobium constans]